MDSYTRTEQYLNGILNGGDVPEPYTREEQLLYEIAKNGGGGGGSDLPAVTSDDNGKVLKVVNGAWDKGTESGGGNDFLVEFTLTPGVDDEPTTVATETPIDDIIAAINAGKVVRCKATKRINIGEGMYIQNVMFGAMHTYTEMSVGQLVKYVIFDVFDFDSEHLMSWRSSTIAGGYAIQEGEQSEDRWMYVPWEKD